MAWLPFEKYVLYSKLTVEQIKEKFETVSDSPFMADCGYNETFFSNPKNTDVFKGIFFTDHFTVKAQVPLYLGSYLNSFRPEARVKFIAKPYGTLCTVTLKLNPVVVWFLISAISFVLIGLLVTSMADLLSGNFGKNLVIIPGLLLFIYLISTMGFNSELLKIKEFIKAFLEID